MGLYYRIFGASDTQPEPAAIEGCLAGQGAAVAVRFSADDAGWFAAEIVAGPGSPLVLERWLGDEEGIRGELNAWAAFLETCDWSPHAAALMERVIQTRQLFTLRKPIDHPDEALVDRLAAALSRHLARVTGGFYQADRQGVFEADGTLLVQEY